MGIEPLDESCSCRSAASAARLAGRPPLWYYVLKEAEIETAGEHLGPVGGRIVAEVLVGLLAGDPLSYLSVDPTGGRPFRSAPARFTLSDLVDFGLKN